MIEFAGPDEWHDFFRIALIAISVWCVFKLLKQFRENDYNTKTKDHWFALMAWSVVGIVQPVQGILLDRPLTPAFITIAAAVLVTGKALHQKGPWGGDDR